MIIEREAVTEIENVILSFKTKNYCDSCSINFLTPGYALQRGSHQVKLLCRKTRLYQI